MGNGISAGLAHAAHKVEGANFAAHLQLQETATKAPLSRADAAKIDSLLPKVEESAGAATGKVIAKSGPAKKIAAPASKKAVAMESSGVPFEHQTVAEAPPLPGVVVPVPMVHEVLPKAAEQVKVGKGAAVAPEGGAKVIGSRVHEPKSPVVAGHSVAGLVGTGTTHSERSPMVAAEPTGGDTVGRAAPLLVEGVGHGAGASVAPLLAVPETMPAGSSGIAKVIGGELRMEAAATPNVHEEIDGAGAADSAGSSPDETRTLVATPHVLEVGITGGAHGWLRVRAELEHTGEVTASLVASSSASADALHKELGAMSAYLKSEVVEVSSLAVTAMTKGGAMQGAGAQGGSGPGGSAPGAGSGSGMQQRGGGDAKQSGWLGIGGESAGGFKGGQGARTTAGLSLGAGLGGWLNVRV